MDVWSCNRSEWCPCEQPKLQRIIISTQADYCQEQFPFWYRWYTQIFPADLIFVLAVETPVASTDATEAFYNGKPGVHFQRIRRENFEPGEAWDVLTRWANGPWLRPPYMILSADTDQYFELPLSPPPAHRGLIFFHEVELASDHVPSVEQLAETPLRELSLDWRSFCVGKGHFTTERRAALYNIPSCPRTGAGSHCYPPDFVTNGDSQGYHWIFSGADAFVRKVHSLTLAKGDKLWWHWPQWAKMSREQSEDALRVHYAAMVREGAAGPRVERFKRLLIEGTRADGG
jgi:hypothetical protein